MNSNLEKLARAASAKAQKGLSHELALKRIAARGLEIKTFVDAGAARGAWSLIANEFWPDAHFHLLEAKDVWLNDLEQLCRRKKNFSYALKAVSDARGSIYFPKGGRAYAGAAFKTAAARDDLIEVPATTIDDEVSERELTPPYAIKLDTHGTEIDILAGARKTLKNTSLICIETYNFIGQKRFPEMLSYLQTLGFRVADLSEPLFRPRDAALWQIDFYLMRADHLLFDDNNFA